MEIFDVTATEDYVFEHLVSWWHRMICRSVLRTKWPHCNNTFHFRVPWTVRTADYFYQGPFVPWTIHSTDCWQYLWHYKGRKNSNFKVIISYSEILCFQTRVKFWCCILLSFYYLLIFAAQCYASAAYVVMWCLSVHPCVRHIREFCQNE